MDAAAESGRSHALAAMLMPQRGPVAKRRDKRAAPCATSWDGPAAHRRLGHTAFLFAPPPPALLHSRPSAPFQPTQAYGGGPPPATATIARLLRALRSRSRGGFSHRLSAALFPPSSLVALVGPSWTVFGPSASPASAFPQLLQRPPPANRRPIRTQPAGSLFESVHQPALHASRATRATLGQHMIARDPPLAVRPLPHPTSSPSTSSLSFPPGSLSFCVCVPVLLAAWAAGTLRPFAERD